MVYSASGFSAKTVNPAANPQRIVPPNRKRIRLADIPAAWGGGGREGGGAIKLLGGNCSEKLFEGKKGQKMLPVRSLGQRCGSSLSFLQKVRIPGVIQEEILLFCLVCLKYFLQIIGHSHLFFLHGVRATRKKGG